MAVSGIHHVTGIAADAQANVDFYAGFLGLHLVKQTGGFEDAGQLHLFYGDDLGRPGTLVTFLVWPSAGRGRTGLGQVSEIALSVPPESIGDWLTRALSAGVPVEGPGREFGEPVLRLRDPDGLIVKLVGAGVPGRLRGVTLLTETPEATAAFVARFGYRPGPAQGALRRMLSDGDAVDIRAAAGFVPGIAGAGAVDHVAFRAADAAALRAMEDALAGHGPTTVHDRRYFRSLYVRDPGDILIEYATDGPGMTVDEPPGALGRTLFLPPGADESLRVRLPQFARPGEARMPMRDLPFTHRFHRPEDPDGTTLVLLHGTAGAETDLMPLARRAAPRAVLLGVRGRSTEEGVNRWFRRYDTLDWDQADIRAEAEAFAGFIAGAVRGYGLDPAGLVCVGYSNGANLLGAVLLRHPGVVARAALLRPLMVLDRAEPADLAGTRVLMLCGARDPYAPMAPPLEAALRAGGAEVAAETLDAGHELGPEDEARLRAWL